MKNGNRNRINISHNSVFELRGVQKKIGEEKHSEKS